MHAHTVLSAEICCLACHQEFNDRHAHLRQDAHNCTAVRSSAAGKCTPDGVCVHRMQGLAGGLMLCISFVDLLPQSMQVLLEVH